jgi:[ribosomal protein S18]-alanine N-acetyltransferase
MTSVDGPQGSQRGPVRSFDEVRVVRMDAGHLDRVVAIEESCFPHPWDRQVFAGESALPDRSYFVALVKGEVVGYGGVVHLSGEAHGTTVAVDPEHRRSRIGLRLMVEMIESAADHGARLFTGDVRTSNWASQRMLGHLGMRPVGRRQESREPGEDALVVAVEGIDAPDYRRRLRELVAAPAAELGAPGS